MSTADSPKSTRNELRRESYKTTFKDKHQTKKSGSAVRKIKEESAESFSCGLT